jgi:hypothetical protein
MLRDNRLKQWFNFSEMLTMFHAICDHRANFDKEPESIYGKIISSADRNTSVDSILKRAYAYRRKNSPEMSWRQIMEGSYKHIREKFGPGGYAIDKIYFDDCEYKEFLNHIAVIVEE